MNAFTLRDLRNAADTLAERLDAEGVNLFDLRGVALTSVIDDLCNTLAAAPPPPAPDGQLKLLLPNGQTVAAEIGGTAWAHWAVITITTDRPGLRLVLRGSRYALAAELYRLWQAAKVTTVAEVDRDRVKTMTPADVVNFFEQSPHLREMADDVREVLLGKGGAASPSQLEQDLATVQAARLVNPSKADIAEVLTGQRVYGGATYGRVNRVFEALGAATTTAKVSTTAQNAA